MKPNSNQSQIRTLLFVFSSAILFGAAAAIFMANHYDQGASYSLKSILPAPQFTDLFSPSLPLEYSKWNAQKHQWERLSVDLKAYQAFYKTIEEDKSIEAPDTTFDAYMRENPSTLTLFLQPQNQRIQFAAQNYYRVQLPTGWAYFYHPAIEKIAESVFNPTRILDKQ